MIISEKYKFYVVINLIRILTSHKICIAEVEINMFMFRYRINTQDHLTYNLIDLLFQTFLWRSNVRLVSFWLRLGAGRHMIQRGNPEIASFYEISSNLRNIVQQSWQLYILHHVTLHCSHQPDFIILWLQNTVEITQKWEIVSFINWGALLECLAQYALIFKHHDRLEAHENLCLKIMLNILIVWDRPSMVINTDQLNT